MLGSLAKVIGLSVASIGTFNMPTKTNDTGTSASTYIRSTVQNIQNIDKQETDNGVWTNYHNVYYNFGKISQSGTNSSVKGTWFSATARFDDHDEDICIDKYNNQQMTYGLLLLKISYAENYIWETEVLSLVSQVNGTESLCDHEQIVYVSNTEIGKTEEYINMSTSELTQLITQNADFQTMYYNNIFGNNNISQWEAEFDGENEITTTSIISVHDLEITTAYNMNNYIAVLYKPINYSQTIQKLNPVAHALYYHNGTYNAVQLQLTFTTIPNNITYEVIDMPGLMFSILGMPFTFVSTAFNLTLFKGTPYQLNISALFLAILGLLFFIFIIGLIKGKMK